MSKTICIYHSIDLDGWMSGAIVRKWFQENDGHDVINLNNDGRVDRTIAYKVEERNKLYMLGWNYGDEIPDLSEYDRIIMCDISFPKEEMIKLYENNELIWIDHHISAINESKHSAIILSYDDSKGIRDTRYAACELTWKYFFPNDIIPEIVRLLGRYDCFGHKGTNEEQKVLEFQYGARQCISNYEEAYNYLNAYLHSDYEVVDIIHNNGKAIYAYLCTEAKWIYKMGKEIELVETIENVQSSSSGKLNLTRKFLAINRSRFNPVNFGIDYHADGYDGIMCWNFNKDKFTASLYNDNGLVDCSAIAKSLGGGGHKGAAGFVMDDVSKLSIILEL